MVSLIPHVRSPECEDPIFLQLKTTTETVANRITPGLFNLFYPPIIGGLTDECRQQFWKSVQHRAMKQLLNVCIIKAHAEIFSYSDITTCPFMASGISLHTAVQGSPAQNPSFHSRDICINSQCYQVQKMPSCQATLAYIF